MTTGFPTPPAKGFIDRLLARTDDAGKTAIEIIRKPERDRTYDETRFLMCIIINDRDIQYVKRKGRKP